jgi:glycosyltransferase involved in cell wall biosynthesis
VSTVAVVIPTWNMAKTLGRALGSACLGGADEVVVIDDASTDDTYNVVQTWQKSHPHVQYVRHPEKSTDHNAAQRHVWLSLKSDQIIGLAADDWLYPAAIEAIRRNAHAPVVFTDADAFDEIGRFIHWHISDFYGYRAADEIRARICGPANLIESGIGSSLRRDMVHWLWGMHWEMLGPLMDSVGYGTVASLFGAVYVQAKGAGLTVRQRSYGRNPDWTDNDYRTMGMRAVGWMEYAGLDRDTIRAMARKRCYVEVA